MSLTETVIEGTIQPDGTLVLDEPTKLPAGRVQVIVQVIPQACKDDLFVLRIQEIWRTQIARGHVARSVDEVEADRQKFRDDWDQRMLRIEQVRQEAEVIRKSRETEA